MEHSDSTAQDTTDTNSSAPEATEEPQATIVYAIHQYPFDANGSPV